LDIQVLSRNLIYIDGKKMRMTKLFFDNYFSHCRDVFYSKSKELVIKIDQCDFSELPKNRWKSDTENQSKIELRRYRKFLKSEKIFFPEPISGGFFIEDGQRVHYIVERLFYRAKGKKACEHRDYGRLEKIFEKYDLCDMDSSGDDRNCFVDVSDRLIYIDWAL
jgi:hypothetical protein